MRSSIVVCLLSLLACSPRSSADGPGSAPSKGEAPSRRGEGEAAAGELEGEAPATTGEAKADAGALDPSYAVMQKVCQADCAGGYARVTVFRDGAGRAARLRFDGDPDRCSHPPRIYFDGAGVEQLRIGLHPVVPGSAEAEALAAKQAAEIEGLREAETLSCFNPEFCAPARTEGFRSQIPCRSDSDCVPCACEPVDRGEWDRRGGPEACNIDGEECIATNAACCAGVCVLAR